MCLGDVLSFCCTPLLACTKYICAALGIALVFSAGVVGLDLKADWPILLIVLACLLAIIWFIVSFCGSGLLEREDEEDYLCKQFELICETQVILREYEVRHNYATDLADSCIQINNTVLGVFYGQMLHALIIVAMFILLTVWFLPVGAKVGYVLGVLFGYGAITLIAWATFSFAGRSVSKVLINAITQKDELFSFLYTCGFGVVMLSIAALYFIFLIVFFIFKNLNDLKGETPQEKLLMMGLNCCGYGLGVIVGAFIYREATSILGRGLFNAIDGLIKEDKNLSFNNQYISQPTKILYVIQNILSCQIVNALDSVICMAVLTISAFVLFSESEEISKENITWKSLLAPTLYFCVNCFCAVIVSMFKTIIWNDEVVAFTKLNVRLQVIIAHCVTLIIFLLMPMVTILNEFSVSGVEAPDALKKEAITIKKITYSCILGQLCNLLLLALVEWLTSHGCSPVRNMALASSERVQTQHLNYGDYLAACGQILIVVTLGIIAAAVFNLAGYAGLMAAAAGFLINVMIMVPIFYIGSLSSDGYKLCCAAHVTQVVTDRLHKMSWAARNYMVYLTTTNAGAAALLALTFMGCALYIIKGESNPLFDFNGAFGLIFGIGLAFLIKGMTVGAVVSVSKLFNMNIFESGIAAQIAKAKKDILNQYVDEKFWISIIWVYIIFLTDTLFMLLFGFFFGKQGSPGFLLGHSVCILFMMTYSIIKGTTLKHSRYYNEVDDKIPKRGRLYQSYVQGDLYGTVMEESTAIPLIVYLLYNMILVTCLNSLFGADGDLFASSKKE